MKKIINRLFLAMMLSMSLLAACTTEEDAPAPNFPEKVSRIVNIDEEGGNIVTLSISPNQDWVVSIPSSASDYWAILDNEQQVLSTGGPAGNYDVRIICLAAEADLDSHTVDVSMRMGGETRVIATITLAEGDAVFNVYQANPDSDTSSLRRRMRISTMSIRTPLWQKVPEWRCCGIRRGTATCHISRWKPISTGRRMTLAVWS